VQVGAGEKKKRKLRVRVVQPLVSDKQERSFGAGDACSGIFFSSLNDETERRHRDLR